MKLPEDFLLSLINCTGFDEEGFIAAHESGEPVTAIRINNQKIQAQQLDFTLKEQVPWNKDGFYLAERPSFTLDPFFHAGAYYVQDASSMFLAEALKQTCNL
ncbi:MAG TPA: Fmu (Sun) domain protein, partial [Ferruginibacter sp.]|nr:Fmu (Sun) domain protein [Ferruginibacter sp.]